MIARIPEMDASLGAYADLASKREILADIDRIAAQYRLIPGPDFYTHFRHNIEFENGTYMRGDGVHHTELGNLQLVQGWAEAFARIPFR